MRKLILFIALSFLLGNQFLFSQVPSYVPTNGLVAYWPFSGNANDASGYGNNGTVNGATLIADRNGVVNSAYNFVGENYIDCGTSNSLGLTSSNIMTINYWTKSNSSNFPYIQKYQDLNAPNSNYFVGSSDTSIPNKIRVTANGQNSRDYNIILNQWINITVIYNGLTGTSSFYLNGQFVSTDNLIFSNLVSNQSLIFGKKPAILYPTPNGTLDDIGIWNRALTPQEVSNLYTSCTTTAPTGALTQTFCATPAPTVASLTVTGTGIQWYAAATGGTALATTTALVNGTTYYASQTVSGCESTTRLAVTVTLNDPQITASATNVCSGTPVTLSASTTANVAQNCNLPTNLQTGLVGYWPFCGNANDVSGNANNGTVNGATLTTDRFGNANSAYSFDGVSNYIKVLDNNMLDLTQNLSLSAWIFPNSNTNEQAILGKGNSISQTGYSLLHNVSSPLKTGISIQYPPIPASESFINSNLLNLNTWYYLVGTYNGSELKLYLNGTLVNTFTTNLQLMPNSITDLLIGCELAGYRFFNGKLDDISLYNRALSPAEIAQLYTAAPTYLWSTGETTATINPSPTATTTYWCDVTINGVTCRKSVTITVNTTPVPTGNATQTFCATPAPTVASLTATGTGIQWYAAATGGTALATTTALVNGTTYYASQTVSACESSTRLAVTVTLNDPQITASATTVCSGTPVTLSASTTAAVTQNCNLPANLQTGLVGYWPFCGNANDVSGNANNGTVNGATLTTDRFGNANSAYSFDGVSNVITIQDNNVLHQNVFSISSWVNGNEFNGFKQILSKNIGSLNNESINLVINNNSNWNLTAQIGGQGYYGTLIKSPNSISQQLWHNIVYVYNETLHTQELYLNGIRVANNTSVDLIQYDNKPLTFGAQLEFNVLQYFFNGTLDDIGIWNRALSQSEITQLYTAVPPTYLWSTGETTATINPTPTATTTYWCDVTVNGVTCRKSVTVTVNTPPAPTGALTQTFCATPAPTVASLTATGTGIQWYAAATGGTALATTTALVNGTTYYASQTVSTCESTRLPIKVSLNDPQITASATTVCSGTAVSLSASTTAAVAQNGNLPTNLQTGLIGYWPFNGNANDVSGNANNGTVNGATLTTDRFGNANSAYSFDGNDYLSGNLNIDLNLNFTISSWVNPQSLNGGHFVQLGIDDGVTGCNGIGIGKGGLTTYTNDMGNNFIELSSCVAWNPSSYQIANNIWSLLTITKNNQGILYFVNGSQVHSISSTSILPSNGNFYFGSTGPNPTGPCYYKGMLDEILVYNRALSPSEIAQLYTATPTYLWSTGDTTATINPSPTATTTYWCDVTVNGVTCRKSVTVTVNTPIAPTGALTQTFCATPAPTVASLTATGTGIQWYAAATGGTALATTTALANGTTYYASQTVSGCESTARLAVNVILNNPTVSASITTICSGTNITLTASSNLTVVQILAFNSTYLWSTGETTAAINPSPTTNTTYWCDVTVNGVTCRKSITINVNPNITPTFTQVAAICYGATAPTLPTNSIENITGTWSPAFNNTATTLYTFTPTAGLCATTATMTVTVNPIITPTFTQEADICYGATAPTLPTNSIENITGTWSPAFNNTATTLYTFTPDTGLCASTATMSVTVKPLPAPPTGVSVQTFCANIFPTLQSIIVNPSNVNWYSSSTSTTALPSTTYLPPGVTTYYASQYDSTTGCESNIRLAVSVNVLFENSPSTIEDQTYCSSDEKTIGDIITGGLNIVWYTTPNGGTPVSNSIILSSSSTLYAAIFNPITGCESPIRTKVEITIINCLLVSNNLLTINDNDLNDNLNIQNIENFPVNQIEIYNRLGELVWKTDYYNNADISFQGKANVSGVYQINSYLPTGTYYYILKYYDPYHIKYNEMKSFLYINNNN